MAKVIVDIPDEMWNTLQIGQYQMGYAEYVARYVEKGKLIPSNVTNGDVIKAVFPNAKIDEIERFKDYPETRVIWEGLIAMCPTFWWNEPYKVGDTD